MNIHNVWDVFMNIKFSKVIAEVAYTPATDS